MRIFFDGYSNLIRILSKSLQDRCILHLRFPKVTCCHEQLYVLFSFGLEGWPKQFAHGKLCQLQVSLTNRHPQRSPWSTNMKLPMSSGSGLVGFARGSSAPWRWWSKPFAISFTCRNWRKLMPAEIIFPVFWGSHVEPYFFCIPYQLAIMNTSGKAEQNQEANGSHHGPPSWEG